MNLLWNTVIDVDIIVVLSILHWTLVEIHGRLSTTKYRV